MDEVTSKEKPTALQRNAQTSRADSAARRFARLPFGAFVRKLSASGYPLHLPQATWVIYQISTVGLQPTSHMFYTAYPKSVHTRIITKNADSGKTLKTGWSNSAWSLDRSPSPEIAKSIVLSVRLACHQWENPYNIVLTRNQYIGASCKSIVSFSSQRLILSP